MGGSCLAERLSHYLALTEREQSALSNLEQRERQYRRGSVVVREHESARDLFIVQKGWLYSCVLLDNGSRQIMRLHFLGDLVGLSTVAFGLAADSIIAVTDVTLCPFDKDRLADLFAEHPRLAALIFTLTVAERASIADRLVSIGRTSARARVASLLSEIFARLGIMNGQDSAQAAIPLTQEDIGDATGLTAVHVNRMMRALADDGLIERSGNLVRLLHRDRLAEEARFVDRFAAIDLSWLPPPR